MGLALVALASATLKSRIIPVISSRITYPSLSKSGTLEALIKIG